MLARIEQFADVMQDSKQQIRKVNALHEGPECLATTNLLQHMKIACYNCGLKVTEPK